MRFHLLAVGLASAACLFAACEFNTAPASPRALAVQHALHDEIDDGAHVVMGTGDAAIDVPAVQAAVDQGGNVVLKGHFSFGAPPTKPVASTLGPLVPAAAEVLLSKAVTISGGEDDEMPTIDAGTIPFYVEARGAAVTIRRVRFVRPTFSAVLVAAVDGLEVASNRVEGLQPFGGSAEAISVITSFAVPTPSSPGSPQNVAGRLSIVHNYIDAIGGTSHDNTLGVTVFSAGVPGAEVEANVSGNTIKNTTEPAINFRRIVGRAHIAHNVIATGALAGRALGNQAIRVVNIGTYVIAHNSIDCGWPTSDAQGIGVFSQFAAWPIEHAVVVDNDITMSAPASTAFSASSAGIGVFGFANDNIVRHNTIRGRALAGLSIPVFAPPSQTPPSPQDNAFIRNRFVSFTPSVADIFVGRQALGTRIVGPGTVVDQGSGTTIQR